MTTPDRLPLLLLPGLINDARLWLSQVSQLSDIADAKVGDLTVADSIPDLAASVLAHAPAERFALAGLSMGGYVAMEIMRQAPERVIALALLDTSARADTPEAMEGRRKLMELAETDFPAVIATLLPKMVHPSQVDDAAVGGVFKAMAFSVGKRAFLSQQRAILGRIDSRPSLAKIACPSLVLCGREDVLTPVAVHEEIAAGIAGSRLVVIEECGHLSTLGQPKQVTLALRQWLLSARH